MVEKSRMSGAVVSTLAILTLVASGAFSDAWGQTPEAAAPAGVSAAEGLELAGDLGKCEVSVDETDTRTRFTELGECLEAFEKRIAVIKTTKDEALAGQDKITVLLDDYANVLTEVGIMLAEDGPLRRGLNDLELAIDDQESTIDTLPADTAPEDLKRLKDSLVSQREAQKQQSDDLSGLRRRVLDQLTDVTNKRPVLVAQIKSKLIDEALSLVDTMFGQINQIVSDVDKLDDEIRKRESDT